MVKIFTCAFHELVWELKAKFFLYVALLGGRVPARKESRFVFAMKVF